MKRGGSHHWSYRGHWYEKKTGPGRWKIDFKATKNQRGHRGVKPGSRYHWRIVADQYAVKTRSGRYQTRMVGRKYLVNARPRVGRR